MYTETERILPSDRESEAIDSERLSRSQSRSVLTPMILRVNREGNSIAPNFFRSIRGLEGSNLSSFGWIVSDQLFPNNSD